MESHIHIFFGVLLRTCETMYDSFEFGFSAFIFGLVGFCFQSVYQFIVRHSAMYDCGQIQFLGKLKLLNKNIFLFFFEKLKFCFRLWFPIIIKADFTDCNCFFRGQS